MNKYEVVDHLKEKNEKNRNKLNSCPRHSFIKNEDLSTYMPRYTCQNCGGAVSQEEKIYYEIGVLHGREGR